MSQIQLRGITERDIDLLLLEELVVSPDFREWFRTEVGLAPQQQLASVSRSVVTSTGESDLEATFELDGFRTRLLVENKIDAAFQRRQSERYRERATAYLTKGECDRVVTVVIAPASYRDAPTGFDRAITYEAVRAWFVDADGGDARSAYKLSLLDAAIRRGEGGWKLVPDEHATAFWRAYWETAMKVAPDLQMAQPGKKPATSSFLRFRPIGLPKGVALLHKVPYGNVDLQFAGQAARMDDFVAEHGRELERGMSIEPANKSLVIRIAVPPIAMEAPFVTLRADVRAGLKAATRLLSWYRNRMG